MLKLISFFRVLRQPQMLQFFLELERKETGEIEMIAISVCKIIFVERTMLVHLEFIQTSLCHLKVVFTVFKSSFKLTLKSCSALAE